MKKIMESKKSLKLGQIVFLGSTKLANMDLYDYLRDTTSFSIYNESVQKLKIEDVEKCVEMISNLQPSKLFISIRYSSKISAAHPMSSLQGRFL